MTVESMADWLVVIPARLNSQRLPRKPLADLAGKPLIVRVFENLSPLRKMGAEVIVATDNNAIVHVCEEYKIPVRMTGAHHKSGTDRCWEVAQPLQKPYILNVQGDEPFMNVSDLITLCQRATNQENFQLATLGFLQTNPDDLQDPNVVKIVINRRNEALYFSRASLPYDRDHSSADRPSFWQHMGVYAFSRDALRAFCQLPPGILEGREKLEQLRALENGMSILIVKAETLSHGIDTEADLEAARERY